MKTHSSARASNETRTAPCKAKQPKKKSSKHTAERLLEELIAVLEDLPAFSYALISDGNYGVGPTLVSAVDLVCNACDGMETGYDGPYPEWQFVDAKAEAARRHKEIVETVTAWVEQLKQAGASFVLVWQAFGETQPHIEYSADYDWDRVCADLVDFIHEEILCRCT